MYFLKNKTWLSWRQDGRVEGLELTSSHENTKITTNCWKTINKKDLTLPKNIFYIQRQGRSHNKTVGGTHLWDNQISYPPDGWHTNWKIIISQKFSNRRVLRPMSGSPAWRSCIRRRSPQSIWLWRPAGLDHRNSTVLGKIETPLLESENKVLCELGLGGKAGTS